MDVTVFLCLFISHFGEVAGHGVVGLAGFADQVQRDHGKLAGGTGLEKQDLVAVGHIHQPATTKVNFLNLILQNVFSSL